MNKGTLRGQTWFCCRELRRASRAASTHSHGSSTSVPLTRAPPLARVSLSRGGVEEMTVPGWPHQGPLRLGSSCGWGITEPASPAVLNIWGQGQKRRPQGLRRNGGGQTDGGGKKALRPLG